MHITREKFNQIIRRERDKIRVETNIKSILNRHLYNHSMFCWRYEK